MTDQPTPHDEATRPDQWEAIASFLASEGSAADSADIRQWLIDHPADAHVVASLETLLPAPALDVTPRSEQAAGTLAFGRSVDVEGALRRVHAQMETERSAGTLSASPLQAAPVADRSVRPPLTVERSARTATVTSAPARKRSWQTNLFAAAAVMIAAVGLIQGRSRPKPPAETAAVTHSSPVGSSDSVTLADGSLVILSANSRLTVSANYGEGQRSVELQGAARFTVKHDEARPFSVRMGNAMVRDLGTVFTVKSAGSAVIVAVTEGSVSLSDTSGAGQRQAIDLKAGDRGRVMANGSVVPERGAVTPDDAAWVVGELVYRDATWAEVQSDLRRWYGVELVVADSTLLGYTVSDRGARTNEPASRLIERLAMSIGAVATTRGDTIVIDRPGARSRR